MQIQRYVHAMDLLKKWLVYRVGPVTLNFKLRLVCNMRDNVDMNNVLTLTLESGLKALWWTALNQGRCALGDNIKASR